MAAGTKELTCRRKPFGEYQPRSYCSPPPYSLFPGDRRPSRIFDGKSLSGWHVQGRADWRAAGGQLAGTAKGSGGGWLVLDHGYEDLVLKLTYQCNNCQTGVLIRNAAPPAGGNTSGLYVSLAGDDAATVYRISLDGQGNETARTLVQSAKSRGGMATIQPLADGWKQAQISVVGDVAVDPPAGAVGRGRGRGPRDEGSHFGQLALKIGAGDVGVKNVSVIDLTRPTMGLPPEVTGPEFRKLQLTDRYYSEGISAGDINRDGKMDVVSGPYAYLGPDFRTGLSKSTRRRRTTGRDRIRPALIRRIVGRTCTISPGTAGQMSSGRTTMAFTCT